VHWAWRIYDHIHAFRGMSHSDGVALLLHYNAFTMDCMPGLLHFATLCILHAFCIGFIFLPIHSVCICVHYWEVHTWHVPLTRLHSEPLTFCYILIHSGPAAFETRCMHAHTNALSGALHSGHATHTSAFARDAFERIPIAFVCILIAFEM